MLPHTHASNSAFSIDEQNVSQLVHVPRFQLLSIFASRVLQKNFENPRQFFAASLPDRQSSAQPTKQDPIKEETTPTYKTQHLGEERTLKICINHN